MKPRPGGRDRPTPGLSKGALKVRKPKVTDLFESEAVFLCTHDLEGRLLTINEACSRALGYAESDLVGRSIGEILAPEYREEFGGYLARIRGSGAATGVMTVVTRAGEKRYWHYQNVLRSEGAREIAHATAIDVTELIHAERSALHVLDQRTAYLRAILEHSPLAILAHDADRRVQLANPAFEKLFQYEEGELLGRDIDDVIAPAGAIDELRANSNLLISGSLLREAGKRRRKDGTLVDVEILGVPLFDGGVLTGACAIYRDISEQKRADEALRAAEERYRLLFERNLAGIYRSMPDGTLLDCNEAFANILGFPSREEILARNARSLYFYESDRDTFLDEVASAGEISGREICLRRRDGTAVWVFDNITFIPASGESPAIFEGSIIDISDRRNAEEAVRVSEERYRFLFDRNPLPMWVYEIESLRFLDVNEAAVAHYGYSRAELLSMRISDLWPPEDRDLHPVAKVATNPQPFSASRHVRKNGEVADVEVSAVDLPGGQVRRRMALARDVTEQKAAERALVESERKYRHIFDFAPVGIYQTTADGRVLTVNPAFAQMLGYTADELVRDLSAYDLYLHPEERDAAIRDFNESFKPGMTIERALKGKTGDPVWVRITAQAIRDEENRVEYLEGFTFDVTETKRVNEQQARLQEAVLETARQWRDTFDAIDTPIFVVDGDALVKRLNRAAIELSGQTYVDILGRPLDALADGPLWKTAAGLVRHPESERSRSGIVCHDEEARKVWEISVSGYQAPDSKEAPMSIVILRDVTATVKLQESVLRAESMSSMGSLVAGVAHEVRNPLFAISATLDAFDARFRERDDYKKYAQALRTQLDRMSHLMRDLLDYGRPAILEFREVAPTELVHDAVRGCSDLASRTGVPVEVEVPESLPVLRVDRGRTVQVFINLVENAIQHSPGKLPVRVRAEQIARDGTPGVRFTVEDRGPGFQAADIPKLFDPFFTKRQGGTGLGLAIVRRIVEEHGGTISPANRPDGGASISVWIPCEPPAAAESERKT